MFGGDQPDIAAIALGAADHLRAGLGEPSGPAAPLGQALDAARERILGALGPDEFSVQKATGAGLPVDEVLALVANRLRDGAERQGGADRLEGRESGFVLLVSVNEAARALGIGRSKTYDLIAAGELETVHIGRAVRVPVDAVERFVEALRRPGVGSATL